MAAQPSVLEGYLKALEVRNAHEHAQNLHDEAQKQLEELSKFHAAEIKIHQGESDRAQKDLELKTLLASQQMKNHFMEQVGSGLVTPQGGTPNYAVQDNLTRQQQEPLQSQPQDIQNLPQQGNRLQPALRQTSNTYDMAQQLPPEIAKYLGPGDRNVTINTPQEQAIQKAGAARILNQPEIEAYIAKEQGKAAAEAPTKEAERGSREKIEAAKEGAANVMAQMSAAARLQAAEIAANSRKYAANLNAKKGSQVNADELADVASQATLGLGDLPSGANKIHVQSIIKQSGQVPFTAKESAALNATNDLDGVFSEMRSLVPQLAKTPAGATFYKGVSVLPISTDFRNQVSQIQARLPQVVRGVMGVGANRINLPEINASKLLVGAGNTQEQATQNIDKLERDVYGKIYSNLLGNIPVQQKIAILQTHGMLDKFRKATVDVGGKSVPVIKTMSDGNDAILDPQTKTYVEIQK